MNTDRGHPCACCGFLTIFECDSFEICPVCFWEDDNVQFRDIDFEGGANKENLRKARENFKNFGASSREFLKFVRPPLQDETP
jgi:hypothetical protein